MILASPLFSLVIWFHSFNCSLNAQAVYCCNLPIVDSTVAALQAVVVADIETSNIYLKIYVSSYVTKVYAQLFSGRQGG